MKNLRLQLLLTVGLFLIGATELLSQSQKYQNGCDISFSNISYQACMDTMISHRACMDTIIIQIKALTIRIDNREETKRYIFFNSAEERNLNDEEFLTHRFFSHKPYTFYQAMRDSSTLPIFVLNETFIKPLEGREIFLIDIEGADDAYNFILNTIRIITEEQLRSHKKLHFIPDMDYCWAFYRHNTLLIPKMLYESELAN